MHDTALLQLLRLCSPALPIGSYAYSQGLETACENDFVTDRQSLYHWLQGLLANSLAYLDAPVFFRLYDAHRENNKNQVAYWNQYILASRETAELFLEDSQMGNALVRLLINLGLGRANALSRQDCSLLTPFSLACNHWQIDKTTACYGLIWAWCENQVGIGIKLIPLGQTSGQRILSLLIEHIASAVRHGLSLADSDIGACCPGAVLASMQHEDQYTRLFRS